VSATAPAPAPAPVTPRTARGVAQHFADAIAPAERFCSRAHRAWAFVFASLTGAIGGGLANEGIAGRLPGQWRFELLLGTLLLAAAATFASILLARAWRDLHASRELLKIATGNLATAFDALLEANRSLTETADARDRALQHLQSAIREREAFLASVSHDLKSPLTLVKGHAELLAKHVRGAEPFDRERIERGLERIAAGSNRATAMIDELLWLARLAMDQQIDLKRERVDLVALARRASFELSETTTRHRILVRSAAPSVEGLWDEARLERVLTNLLSNAVKYSPGGGEIWIDVGVDDAGQSAIMTVTDQGVGIPAADLPHIFERFYRGENVGETIPGTGIGLAGARYVTEAHGGTITVESRAGEGSAFTVRLPLELPHPGLVDSAVA
jgi:signal transduction histidine kinase